MPLTIRKKLLANFAIVCALTIVNAGVVYFRVADLRSRQSNVAKVRIPAIQDINDIRIADQRMVNGLYGYLFTASDAAATEANKKQIAQSKQRVEEDLGRLRERSANFNNPENDKRIAEIGGCLAQLNKAADAIQHEVPRKKGASKRALHLLTAEAIPSANKIRDLSKDLIASVNEITEKDNTELARSGRVIAWMLLGCTATLILLGGVSSWLIASGIVAPLTAVVARAEAIADGDLTGSVLEEKSQDEIAILTAAINRMQGNLSEMLQSVAATAANVASASEEISANANVSAAGAETQRNQVHQVADAMQHISTKVLEVSENSKNAETLASQASQTAHDGGTIVSDTLGRIQTLAGFVRETGKKIEELGSRSDQIGKIISVIKHIADQTNLLALNAAIEAARAGEQGRGFAVVADEVRKLAERTTSATKEIAEVIQGVQSETQLAVTKMQAGIIEVEKGVEATGRAGVSLKQIIGQADDVGAVVTQIATAATQQSSATQQINLTMERISHLVAESAEGAKQSAQACEQLSASALELQQLVNRFKLTGHRRTQVVRNETTEMYERPRALAAAAGGAFPVDSDFSSPR